MKKAAAIVVSTEQLQGDQEEWDGLTQWSIE